MSGSRKVLIRLELCNLFGLNVLRHTQDKKTRRKGRAMAALWAVLLALLFFYVGALSYGLVFLGVPEVIPAYLTAIISLVLFFLDIFKAGGVLFRKGGYDILCSLPVSQTDIVLSRLTRMYAENLAVSLAVLLPGLGVSAWLLRPGVAYCLLGVLSAFFLPLAPLAAAALLGALITAMASRMKHKALAEAGLSILLCVVLLLGSSRLAGLEGELSPALLQELAGTIWTVLGSLYPPAVWFGAAVTGGDLALFGGCAVLFLAVFAAVVAFLSANFHSICRRVHGSSATHDYRLSRQKQSAVLPALCKRELMRYLSSGVYVSNTIIGPIMGTALSAALLFVDLDPLTAALPIDVDVAGLIPFLLGPCSVS